MTAPTASRRSGRFHTLRVAGVERLTPEAVAITFDVPDHLLDEYLFAPGQHVSIRSDHGGPAARRSYSIASPAPDGPLRIGVKRIPGGAFSTWAVERLVPGDELDVMTPSGTFGTDARSLQARRRVAIAAGSGITPVLSIVASLLHHSPQTEVSLVYGSRSTDRIMFFEELEDLKNRYPSRFQLLHVLSRESGAFPHRHGRLDRAKLSTMLGTAVPLTADAYYLCGPLDAVEDWQGVLVDAGVDAGRVHRELFYIGEPGVRTTSAATELQDPGRVIFTLAGHGGAVVLDRGDTILDAVSRARSDAPFACRAGVCGTCRALVVQGHADMAQRYALSDAEAARGFVLTCQARPTTDLIEIDYDR